MRKSRKNTTTKSKVRTLAKTAPLCVLCAALVGTSAIASGMSAALQTTQATQETPEFSEGKMLITAAGTYTLTGSMHGTVFVDPGAGDVTLVLDNVNITGGEAGAIAAVSGDSLTIETSNGSVNSISDDGVSSEYGTAIYSKVNISFTGNGSLNITGNSGQGIRTHNADISFENGEYRISSSKTGLSAEGDNPGRILLNGGKIYIDANGGAVNPDSAVIRNGGGLYDLTLDGSASNSTEASVSDSSFNSDEYFRSEASFGYIPESGYSASVPDADPSDVVPEDKLPEEFPVEISDKMNPDESASKTAPPALPDNADSQTAPPDLPTGADSQAAPPALPNDSESQNVNDQMPGAKGQMPGMNGTISGSTDTAGEIVTSNTVNTAADLTADYDNASTITVTEEDSQVNISESGTYVVTGSSSNGNITVKKGTTGVVLVLEDLDLTSLSGATLSVNKNAEVQIVVSGDVTLTDAENPADEESTDAEIADAFDGAAIKLKAESVVVITGDGTLNLNGNAKNGIKAGDDSSLIIDGDLTLNISAANDGINSNYDVTILDGDVTINAADDGIHVDHILTIGSEDGTGPDLTVESSTEGLEGTVVNIMGGKVDVTSTDDAVNAANGDGVYEGILDYSFNMIGGDLTINAQGDGIDSNGNVNLIDGTASIKSSTQAGEAGIDYDGEMYISDDFDLNNQTGISGQDMIPGMNQNGMNPGAMNHGGPAFGRR